MRDSYTFILLLTENQSLNEIDSSKGDDTTKTNACRRGNATMIVEQRTKMDDGRLSLLQRQSIINLITI